MSGIFDMFHRDAEIITRPVVVEGKMLPDLPWGAKFTAARLVVIDDALPFGEVTVVNIFGRPIPIERFENLDKDQARKFYGECHAHGVIPLRVRRSSDYKPVGIANPGLESLFRL